MSLKLDFSSAEKQREKLTREQQKDIQRLYSQAAKSIAKQAGKAPRVPSDTIKKQYLKTLAGQLTDQLTKINKEVESSIKDSMKSVADSVVSCNKDFLSGIGLTIEGAFSRVPDSIVRSVASGQLYSGNWTLSKAIWNTNAAIQRDVQTIVAQGIAENKSAFDIAKDLEMYVDPAAKKPWDWSKVYPGVHKQIDYNAQRLARTMVSHAYQQAFVQTTKDNPFVTKYRWLSSGGERVCEICESRNGVEYDKDDLPLDHPNGMCTFVAVMESSMIDIADRLGDWAAGKSDPELDKWAEALYGKGWKEQAEKNADLLMQKAMEEEFKTIDAALDRFLHSDGSKTLTEMFPDLDLNEGIVEKHSVKNLIEDYIKPFNEDLRSYGDGFTYWDPDQAVSILYKDGRILYISLDWWDESRKIPTSGIDSIIVDGGWGTAVGGKNIRLYNTREEWEYGKYGYKTVKSRYEDFNDIRADFKKGMRQNPQES